MIIFSCVSVSIRGRFKIKNHRKSIFSQIQKSSNYPRGGGCQENYGLFPQIMVFLGAKAPL